MRNILLFFSLFIIAQSGLSQDYTQYHKSIINAEKQLFINEQLEEGLKTYITTFKQYDFVFLSDVMLAMQISLLTNNEQAFLTLADKATQNGLLPRHLIKFYFIQKHPFYKKHKDSIITLYHRNRPHYLNRIDTIALQKMYDIFAFDQMEKNPLKNESETDYNKRYKPQIKQRIDKLTKLIEGHGFPSDKTIGIYQNDIMSEMKLSSQDLIYYYHNNKNNSAYSIHEGQFQEYEWKFSSNLWHAVIAHNYQRQGITQIHSDTLYLREIKKGNIHPRDMAHMLDFPLRNADGDKLNTQLKKGEKFFLIARRNNIENMEGYYKGIAFSHINLLRERFYIAPIEQDIAKIKFAKKYGIYIPYVANGIR